MYQITCGAFESKEIDINFSECALRLGIPREKAKEYIDRYKNELLQVVNPKYAYIKVPVFTNCEGRVDIGFTHFFSQDLCKNLKGCESAYVMAITTGIETDRFISKKSVYSVAEGFIYDAISSAFAEAICDKVSDLLSLKNSLGPRFSPGYGDAPMYIQSSILDALCAGKLIGISLGENFLMTPRKSITAIQAILK